MKTLSPTGPMVHLSLYVSAFFCLCLAPVVLPAQQLIRGVLQGEDQSPIPFANVVAKALPDSAYVSHTLTGEDGQFELQLDPGFTGFLNLSSIGFAANDVPVEPGRTHYEIVLQPIAVDLEQVVVSGKKALYEMKSDRMVVNISAVPALSGNNALQVLQRSPGVLVDRQNGSISLNAKGEVLIMINDRVQRVPAEVLMARLEGMRAENVERIELIHQPPARYDAAGAAGIIHIVLKENEQYGLNGNASLMAGYGRDVKLGLNAGLNYRKGKVNLFGDYNYNLDRSHGYTMDHFREYDYLGTDYGYENYAEMTDREIEQHNVNLGLDVQLNPDLLVGGLFSYSESSDIIPMTSYSNSFRNDTLVDSFDFLSGAETYTKSYIGNVNLMQRLPGNSQLNLDIDYANIHYTNVATLRDELGSVGDIRADRTTPIDIWTLRLDYVNDLSPTARLEMGVKGTFSDISTEATVVQAEQGDWVGQTLFSGKDLVDERIMAAYVSFSKDFSPKLQGEFGLRYEYYDYRLDASQRENDRTQVFSNPFPIVRLNYKLDSINTLQLAYNRSITRPSFWYMASFFVVLDPSLVGYANPRLLPSFTNTIRLSFQHRSILFSLAYLDNKNTIYFYNTVDKENHLQIVFPNNLDQNRIVEANLTFPLRLAKWWETNWTLSALHQSVSDASDRDLPFSDEIMTWSVQLNSSFSFGKGWSASFDGRYMSDYLHGDQVKFDYPYLNVGIQKQFPSGSSLSLSLMDLTNSIGKRRWEYHQPELGIRTYGFNDWSERQVRLTYSFTFGSQQLRKARNRQAGSEELRNRM